MLAHHLHLEQDYLGDNDGAWTLVPRTVVLVRVPEAVRVVRDLAGPLGEATALVSFGRAPDGAAPDPRFLTAAGRRWRAEPAEDHAMLRAVLEPAAGALPEGASVEVHDGALCLVARTAVTDAAALDLLGHTASALARGLTAAAAAAARPAGTAYPPPADTPAARRAAADAAALAWPEPPDNLAAARAAYTEPVRRPEAARRTRSSALGWSAAGLLAGAGIEWALARPFTSAVAATAIAVVSLAILAPGSLWCAWRGSGREVAARDRGRARQAALGAFADAYARSRRVHEIDRDGLRRRLAGAPAGVPLRAWADDRGGVAALWIDRTDLTAEPAYGVLAVGPDGTRRFVAATPETLTPQLVDDVWAGARAVAVPVAV